MTEAEKYLERKLSNQAAAVPKKDSCKEVAVGASAVPVPLPAYAVPPTLATAGNAPAGWFSAEGRLNRMSYFLRSLCLMPPALIGSALLNSRELVLAGLAMWLFAIVTQFFQTIKRLHDLGQSGWVSLSQLIPFVNIVVGLWLLFGAGTDGANKYGAKPV